MWAIVSFVCMLSGLENDHGSEASDQASWSRLPPCCGHASCASTLLTLFTGRSGDHLTDLECTQKQVELPLASSSSSA